MANKETPLLDFLMVGLKNADSGLGDRSKYIGSSDIGQCPKKSYLSKLNKVEYNQKQLLIFDRGHNAELTVRKGLENHPTKLKFTEQYEAIGKDNLNFIKTHIDFVVEFPNELLIIECKTISSPLPNNNPYESWIYQVQIQLGLLKAMTGKNVRAKILAFDLNTTDRTDEFDVYFNQSLFDIAVERALYLWESLKTKVEPKAERSNLCAFCPFKDSCEALRGTNSHILPDDVGQGLAKLYEIKPLVKDEKDIKENIKAFMEATGLKKGVFEDRTVIYSIRKGKDTVDTDKLRQLYPDVYPLVLKKGEEYGVLNIY